MRLSDALPGEESTGRPAHTANTWVWQRGPRLLVDRVTGHVTVLKPVLARKLVQFDPSARPEPARAITECQREPLRATFRPAGKDAVSFDIVPGSAVLVEDSEDEPESSPPSTKN